MIQEHFSYQSIIIKSNTKVSSLIINFFEFFSLDIFVSNMETFCCVSICCFQNREKNIHYCGFVDTRHIIVQQTKLKIFPS